MPPPYNLPVVQISVLGNGAVAMAAALALARRNLSVAISPAVPTVVVPAAMADDRNPDPRTYALNAASVQLLETLKVWPAMPADARSPVYDMLVHGDGASRIGFSAWSLGVERLAWIVDAAELEAALGAALRFAPNVVQADAADLAHAADLVVIAEGRESAARSARGVQMRTDAYGQRGVVARLESDRAHAGLARQWFRSPDVLALLPFERPAPGRSYGLVWSLPEERARQLEAAAPGDFESELAAATGGAAGALRLSGPRASWPLLHGRADQLHGPGWVLVGDAAHLVHPLAGQGLNLGLGDVAELARQIDRREPWRAVGDARLLARYARAREWPTRAMGLATDGLLRLFADEHPFARELRNRGMGLVDRLSPLKRALARQAIGHHDHDTSALSRTAR